ncbi:MAG: nitrite/sulfite reductase [Acidimicrobiales bacterium]
MEFLTPYRQTIELNKVERWKLERQPLEVYEAVVESYSKALPDAAEAIAAVEGEQERLKWVGIYPQRQGGDAYMMRVKVPGGRLNASQAAVIGNIADTYGRSPAGSGRSRAASEGCCDITTRQDIQLHWIRMAEVPEIWRLLEEVGLTTLQACGDSARNVLCCPVAGLDAEEAFDAFPVARAITDYFTGNREYSNLPRKFKISVTGCLDDCAQAEINDIGLWPARRADGALGFNVLVGGGLSDGPRLASDIDVFVETGQAVELSRAIAQTWGELGNRENRGQSRMRYLVQELGPERFREELSARCGFGLTPAGEALTRRYRGDHVGVHPQRQAGLSYVGLNVTVGRMAGSALVEVGRLAEAYGDGGVRLATDQNLIITGVPDDRLAELLAEPQLSVHSPSPGPFARGAVACTGTEFCRFAIVETKQRMAEWARQLDAELSRGASPGTQADGASRDQASRDQASRDQAEIVRIHLSGCSASCAQPQIADIGLRGDTAKVDGRLVEALDIGLGGSLGTDAAFVDWVEGAKPADEVPAGLARLLVSYQGQRHPGERFYEWARRVPNSQLRAVIAGAAG